MDYQVQRNRLVQWTKKQLIGSELKDNILNGEKPLDRFLTGFLFPILETEEGLDSEDESSTLEDEIKPIKKVKRYLPPSSAGFSFFITGDDIKLNIFHKAVYYKKMFGRDEYSQQFMEQSWERNEIAEDEVVFSPHGKHRYLIFDDKARVDALWRKHREGYIVTVSISNIQKLNNDDDPRQFSKKQNEFSIFELEFKCIVEEGLIDVYPSKDRALLNEEEKEIELRYKDLHIYAVGHGTAVDWKINDQGKMVIWTDFMPTVEVPQVTADTGGENSKVLEFNFLSFCETNTEVIDELKKFIVNYEYWIEEQKTKVATEDHEDVTTANNIVERITNAKKRMEKGVALLESDELARTSFAIANKSMLLQMMATDKIVGKEKAEEAYKWRPFQIAFVLMVMESATNEDSDYRDMLDLIWFPTGGGKTEAYLGLMSFLFVYRRLKYPASSGGTVAIMRYTLRLLTTQQFLRACKVISALELIRRERVSELGEEIISVGLWVGSSSSPNSFSQAAELIQTQNFSKLVIKSCPWCGDVFTDKNYVSRENDFYFSCTNNACEFGKIKDNILPYNVVDEALYKKPPSLLIATVDKFARLAWEERACGFFGIEGSRPPELIIQDELHLISSALGSIVGLYEVAIDTAFIARGMRAKYIASTATIKNASEQVRTLFARDMAIFPPPGLRYDDSYFAKTVPLDQKPGRLYIGYLAPLLARQNCLAPLAATLLAAPTKLFKDSEEYLDSWWSQVIYHGSLKGVGNSRTLYQSGVTTYLSKLTIDSLKIEIDEVSPNYINDNKIKTIDDFHKIDNVEIKKIVNKYLPVRSLNIKTLTSNQSAEENAMLFDALTKEKQEIGSIDVVLATNMISVGLDVQRLAVMIINGQPLTTAEYIQASSRVGRGMIPGLVFINYYKTQARSLSHYENFRSYHDSFYRFVEPTSLTPFTYQARSRALHAALVIAMRFSDVGLLENDKAELFDPENDQARRVIGVMKRRISSAMTDKLKIGKAHDHLDEIVSEWVKEAGYSKVNRRNLVYFSSDKGSDNLIHDFDDKQGLWSTLQSMRNVENVALIKLVKGVKLKDEI